MIEFPDQVTIPGRGQRAAQVHVFDEPSMWAIRGALGAERPLLVRGEPGVGKTQLARAAGVVLQRPVVEFAVDSRTESQDLMWTLDAVRRLAEAQVSGAFPPEEITSRLHPMKFVQPGPLWWAFSWSTAKTQAESVGIAVPPSPVRDWAHGDGAVLLIDEIDKGESDVPNGLLEALGSGTFRNPNPDESEPIAIDGKMPLVIITTNEERVLPDAFVRRCLVLHLSLPTDDAKLKEFLLERGRAHFPKSRISDSILKKAADFLVFDRSQAKSQQVTPLPGQAEFIDLLTALAAIGGKSKQIEAMNQLRAFVFRKHAGSDS